MRLKSSKALIVLASVVAVVLWLTGTKSSQAVSRSPGDDKPAATDTGYVGSDTCQACHEDTFKSYSHTAHAQLTKLSSWKNKATGCESCHGPGKAHVDGSGDVTKIITFKNKTSKEISETCLSCHAAKKSETTSVAVSTGGMILVARTVTRPTRTRREEMLPARTCW